MTKTILDEIMDALDPEPSASYEVVAKQVYPRDIVYGDTLVTSWSNGRPLKTSVVKHVEHYACSQRNTHINGGCYTWSVPIWVLK